MTKYHLRTVAACCMLAVGLLIALRWNRQATSADANVSDALSSKILSGHDAIVSPVRLTEKRKSTSTPTNSKLASLGPSPGVDWKLEELKAKYLRDIKERESKTLSIVAHYTHNSKEIAVVKFSSCSKDDLAALIYEASNDIKSGFADSDQAYAETKLNEFLVKNIDLAHPHRALMVINPSDETKPPQYTLATSSIDNVISERPDGTIGVKTGSGSLSFLSDKDIEARYDFAMSVSRTK
jgi:hypothetical protein